MNPADLIAALGSCGVVAIVTGQQTGPRFESFRLQLESKTLVGRLLSRQADLRLKLGRACSVRCGSELWLDVELPSARQLPVGYSAAARQDKRPLAFYLGQDVAGRAVWDNLLDLPHLLIAGQTGSGKSVALHTIMRALLELPPGALRLALVDVKRVELAQYAGLPHLFAPPAADVAGAVELLKAVNAEVDRRYGLLQRAGFKDVRDYQLAGHRLPFLVLVVDELADVLASGGTDVRDLLIRIAQMARASGVHIIAATQSPYASIIDGALKVNFPARLALAVPAASNSRVVLDVAGAEKLRGKGDALFLRPGREIVRLQVALTEQRDTEAAVAKWPKAAPITVKPVATPQGDQRGVYLARPAGILVPAQPNRPSPDGVLGIPMPRPDHMRMSGGPRGRVASAAVRPARVAPDHSCIIYGCIALACFVLPWLYLLCGGFNHE